MLIEIGPDLSNALAGLALMVTFCFLMWAVFR